MSEPRTATGITVAGVGRASSPPDQVTVTLGVAVLRSRVTEAWAEAARLTGRVVAALAETGAERRNLQTAGLSLSPEYDHEPPGRRRLRGYRAVNQVTVRLVDLEQAGAAIDAAVAAGGNDVTVEGATFGLADERELASQARRDAWQDAHQRARELAAEAGVALGEPVAITESARPAPPMMAAMLAEAATPLEPGRLEVTVAVEVTFSITGPASA